MKKLFHLIVMVVLKQGFLLVFSLSLSLDIFFSFLSLKPRKNRMTLKRCSQCQYLRYCSRQCQKNIWPLHKVNKRTKKREKRSEKKERDQKRRERKEKRREEEEKKRWRLKKSFCKRWNVRFCKLVDQARDPQEVCDSCFEFLLAILLLFQVFSLHFFFVLTFNNSAIF